MSTSEAWTTKRLLEWTTDYLEQNGSISPRLDAEVLLAEAKGCQRIELYTFYDQVPGDDQLAQFRGWIKERAAGKPVAYLVGHREFYSLSFVVNEHVLIPRPETELLVTLAIDYLASLDSSPATVCDVGTGSGCIAIAIAKNNQNSMLTAVDVSKDAIQVAIQNAENLGVTDRITFIESDLLDQVNQPESFDLIVSNPPYIGLSEKDQLPVDVKDHEPELALFAGEDGTSVITRLAQQAAGRLKPGGKFLMETSPVIMDQCVEIMKSQPAFDKVQVECDLSKHPRVVVATRV